MLDLAKNSIFEKLDSDVDCGSKKTVEKLAQQFAAQNETIKTRLEAMKTQENRHMVDSFLGFLAINQMNNNSAVTAYYVSCMFKPACVSENNIPSCNPIPGTAPTAK